jgi:iron complex transport system substrate-binding protein
MRDGTLLSRRSFLAFAGCVSASLLAGGLTGCMKGLSTKAETFRRALVGGDPEFFEFIDSAGRKVALPRKIERISPSGSYAQILLATLCPEKFASLSSKFSKTQAKYLGAELLELPVLGRFYGTNADMNFEEIIRESPDVIVDIGEAKTNIGGDMDRLQEQTGLPVIFVEATVSHLASAYEMLGEALGVQSEAQALANYAQQVLGFASLHHQEIQAQGLKLMYSSGAYGLEVKEKGSVHSGAIDLLGVDNVAVLEGTNSTEVSIEQVALWKPEVLLLSPVEGFFDDIYRSSIWREIPAVKNKRVYEVPGVPYEWLDKPPSVQVLLGLQWLGNLLYPEIYDFDIVERAREFYRLFWHYDLTEDEATVLLKNSTFLPPTEKKD